MKDLEQISRLAFPEVELDTDKVAMLQKEVIEKLNEDLHVIEPYFNTLINEYPKLIEKLINGVLDTLPFIKFMLDKLISSIKMAYIYNSYNGTYLLIAQFDENLSIRWIDIVKQSEFNDKQIEKTINGYYYL